VARYSRWNLSFGNLFLKGHTVTVKSVSTVINSNPKTLSRPSTCTALLEAEKTYSKPALYATTIIWSLYFIIVDCTQFCGSCEVPDFGIHSLICLSSLE
jgi:hypothetical protein